MSENPTAQVEVAPASIQEKLILRHLIQLYSYDFTEFDGVDADDYGLYRYDYFDHYWTDTQRRPYLVRVAGKLAGFALLRLAHRDDGTPYTSMAEFFIMKKYRGKGVGQAAAFYLFDQYPGDWEVSEIAGNRPAQAFWMRRWTMAT